MQLWAETGRNLSVCMFLHCIFHLNSGFMVKGRWQEKAGKSFHWVLETCFQISVLVLRWVSVETPFPVTGHRATEVTVKAFCVLEEVGCVTAWKLKWEWIRQAFLYCSFTCISQLAPKFSQAGIEGAVLNIWHLTGVKVLHWEKLEDACLWVR